MLRWLAGLASLAVLATSGVGYALLTYYDGRLGRITIHLPGSNGPSAQADGAAVNFLLVGSDTRQGNGNSRYQARRGSPDYVGNAHSDVVILMHVPPGQAKATLVSIPRDSYVSIPAYVDAKGRAHEPHKEKFNAAYAEGGTPLMVETVQNLTGMRIDHLVQIDFAGFTSMVDSLGGVTVCVGSRRNDRESGDFLTVGTHHLNGTRALAFVRDRDSFADRDITRIKSQQYFLSVVLHKVLAAGTLANPLTLTSFLHALTASVTVDTEFSIDDMRTFALRMKDLNPAHVDLLTLPFVTSNGTDPRGASIVEVDYPKTDALFAALRRGDEVTGAAEPAANPSPSPVETALSVAPSAVQVNVRNGAGISGLAARAAKDLRDVGFSIASVGNATTPRGATTLVRYGATRADSARTLVAAVPGTTLQFDPSLGRTLTLVVGSDYSGTQQVDVSSPAAVPEPSSTASTQRAAPPATAANVSCAP